MLDSTGVASSGTTDEPGPLVPCSERLAEFEQVYSAQGNAVTGAQLPDADLPARGVLLEFGPAASESCLGTGSVVCVPQGTPLPAWFVRVLMFESLAAGSFELPQGLHIEPDDDYPLVYFIDNGMIEPECFPTIQSTSILGQLEVVDFDDDVIVGYVCDSDDFPGVAWEFTVNRC